NALRVARIATVIEPHRERVTLRQVVDEAVLVAETEADPAGIAFTWKLDGEVTLDADLRLLRSALGNVVRNAVKYSHAGGNVELRGKVVRDRVVIEVGDAGGGWPDGAIDQAFTPFVRMTSDKTGHGLGLAIAKQAVDAHGGTIRIQNLPGKGCIVVMELPL